MGQAKRKADHAQAMREKLEAVDLERVSLSLRKLAAASSSKFGGDCHVHALLAKALLADLGVEAEVALGFAAWRVGPGDGDVVVHVPLKHIQIVDPKVLPFHAWLVVADRILDFTTYQLRFKASELDKQDGATTTVDWCPDYLDVSVRDVSCLRDVTQLTPGLFYYERNLEVERKLQSNVSLEEELTNLRIIYANPHVMVFGVNNLPPAAQTVSRMVEAITGCSTPDTAKTFRDLGFTGASLEMLIDMLAQKLGLTLPELSLDSTANQLIVFCATHGR